MSIDLGQVGAFRFVLPEFRRAFAQLTKIVEKTQGETILLFKEPVPGIYIVADGEVGIYPPGSSTPLVTMGPMSSFGEMSFLENSPASATIRSETPRAVLLLLLHEELKQLMEKNHHIAKDFYRGIATNLSQKLRNTTERMGQELGSGREILLSLSTVDQPPTLEGLPLEASKQNDLIINSIKISAQLAEDISKGLPTKHDQLIKLQASLMATKEACLTYYPKLAHQVAVIIDFVRRMDKFVLRMTQH